MNQDGGLSFLGIEGTVSYFEQLPFFAKPFTVWVLSSEKKLGAVSRGRPSGPCPLFVPHCRVIVRSLSRAWLRLCPISPASARVLVCSCPSCPPLSLCLPFSWSLYIGLGRAMVGSFPPLSGSLSVFVCTLSTLCARLCIQLAACPSKFYPWTLIVLTFANRWRGHTVDLGSQKSIEYLQWPIPNVSSSCPLATDHVILRSVHLMPLLRRWQTQGAAWPQNCLGICWCNMEWYWRNFYFAFKVLSEGVESFQWCQVPSMAHAAFRWAERCEEAKKAVELLGEH